MGVVIRRWVWLAGGRCEVEYMGVVIRRRVWLAGGMYGCGYQPVGVVGTIGVVSGCFPHITYISLLHLYLLFFAAASLLLFSFCYVIL